MRTLMVAACLAVAPAATQCPPSLDGDWQAVELRTAKGTVELQSDGVRLFIEKGKYRFVYFKSEGNGKAVIVAKAGRLDLIGEKGTFYGSYTLDGDTLTVALWGDAADRQAMPSTDKSGIVFKFRRQKKGVMIDT